MFPERFGAWMCSAFVALSIGCGSSDEAPAAAAFSGAPVLTVTTDAAKATIAIRSSPPTPVRGVNAFELTVLDAKGAPVDGLAVTIVPWMPSHGHGASVKPTVTSQGHGVYIARDVDLYMPGRWELRTALHGPLEDTAAPTIDAP